MEMRMSSSAETELTANRHETEQGDPSCISAALLQQEENGNMER